MTQPNTDYARDTAYSRENSYEPDTEDKTSAWLRERKEELARVLEDKSRELANKAKSSLSTHMTHYESAAREASSVLASNDESHPAAIVDTVASQIGEARDYIKNSSPEELYRATSEQVRKAPLLSFGLSILAGVAFGRVLHSAYSEGGDGSADPQFAATAPETDRGYEA